MTAIPSRSVLDEYLPGYARDHGVGPRRRVLPDDMPELIVRMRRVQMIPHGEGRMRAKASVADDFGVTVRTLERYWRNSAVTWVHCGPWRAQFVLRDGETPRQVSAWERAA